MQCEFLKPAKNSADSYFSNLFLQVHHQNYPLQSISSNFELFHSKVEVQSLDRSYNYKPVSGLAPVEEVHGLFQSLDFSSLYTVKNMKRYHMLTQNTRLRNRRTTQIGFIGHDNVYVPDQVRVGRFEWFNDF